MTVKSPDGNIVFSLTAGEQMKYSVVWNTKTIIKDAALGISIDGDNLGVKAQTNRFPQVQLLDDKFPVRGVHATGATRCQSAVIAVTSGEHVKTWNLEVRVFNDGVAYRYNVPGNGKRHVDGESSSWNLPAGTEWWYLEGKNLSYEGKFKMKRIGEFEAGSDIMAMATAVLPDGGYAMLSEANVFNYSDLALMPAPDSTFKAFFHNDQEGWVQESGGPVVSPWRVTLLAADLNVLVNQDVLRSLCPPPSVDFTHATYVRPGRSIWHWLTGGGPPLEEQHIVSQVNWNNDGFDIDGCHNVIVRNCVLSGEDDGLCFKGAGLRTMENVLVENCKCYSTCNALKFGGIRAVIPSLRPAG